MSARLIDTEPAAEAPRRVLFGPIDWPGDIPNGAKTDAGPAARFADQVRAVAYGVGELLRIVESDAADEGLVDSGTGEPVPRLVSEFTTGRFMRLSSASLQMLGEKAELYGEALYSRHCKDGAP